MKKEAFTAAVVALLATVFTACNNSPQSNDTQNSTPSGTTELRFAFVEIDSITSQYTFAQEVQQELQTKTQNIQNTIAAREQTVNSAMAKLQQDVQANLLTQDEAEKRYNNIMQQGNDVQALNQRLTNELQAESEKMINAINDSIQHYLAVYNKDKQYTFIFTKGVVLSFTDATLLYADPRYDITDEVIAGLNKTYKPAKGSKSSKSKGEKKAKK